MKKNITLFLALIAISITYGQNNIPVTNGDFESTTSMSTTDNKKYSVDGFYILENTPNDVFNEASSGLAPGAGVNGSQALKSVIHNSSANSSQVVLFTNRVDISAYGAGKYTFSIQLKSEITPTAFPIWMVVAAFDEDNTLVSSATVTYVKNGGNVKWQDLTTGFQEAYVEVNLVNNPSGKNAKFLELRLQHARENNTFYFDDFKLTTSATLNTKSFDAINVKMYPNPTNGFTTIKSDDNLENITLYSIAGKLLLDKKVNTNDYTIDVSSYAKGVYFLGVKNSKGKSVSKLIVK